ncbi:MAG: penicillin-binding transpeptidase domain-containing protein [bacterium]|nr:penicillin-binding transpeptidase domain-containing protein [bacterium]
MENKKIRILIFFFIIAFSFCGLIARLCYLQLFQNKKMTKLSISNYLKKRAISTERGIIYDRNMKELAASIESYSLYTHPRKIFYKEQTAKLLSPFLKIPEEEIFKNLCKDSSFIWLKRKLNKSTTEKLKQLNINGLGFIKEYKRIYPKKELASHVIGFVGLDNQGLEGAELYFNQQLRGPQEEIEVTIDAIGRTIFSKTGNPTKSFDGFNIVLTIDEVMQQICEEELQKVCEKYHAIGGTIIIMDPINGEILSLANFPTFNLNRISSYPSYMLRNRAITDLFEPGSTFKIFTTAAILINRVITNNDRFVCEGGIEIAGRKMRCCSHHGKLSFEEVIAKSCNVGTIKAAMKLNQNDFYECLERFGFGSLTGINLPGERSGTLLSTRYWSKLTLPNFAIGQGISTTALQLTTAVCSIANGGFLLKPLIIKKITNSKNEVIKEYQPTCIKRVLHPNVAKYITYILQKVVSEGTGKKAFVSEYTVAGKTGTAQKADTVKGGYAKGKFFSSFIGYTPANNSKLVISVFINEPKEAHYGGEVAAPTFTEIVGKILAYKKPYFIPESQRIEYVDITNCNLSKPKKEDNSPTLHTISEEHIMPDLYGNSMRMVWKMLLPYQAKINFYGSGIAIESIPKRGERITPNQKIKVWFSPINISCQAKTNP